MPILPENKKRYPKDWALRSRFIRCFRAKGKCEWCGVLNGAVGNWHPELGWKDSDWWQRDLCGNYGADAQADELPLWYPRKMIRIVLTTAHIWDERPEACNLDNLAALCQRCHNRHDAQARQARRIARRDERRGQGQLNIAVAK